MIIHAKMNVPQPFAFCFIARNMFFVRLNSCRAESEQTVVGATENQRLQKQLKHTGTVLNLSQSGFHRSFIKAKNWLSCRIEFAAAVL